MDVDLKKLQLNIQPHVLAQLLSLNDNSDINFSELDKLVKSDQNMATIILKAANSSLYSRGNEIRTIQHAISMLGFQIVRSLATVAASRTLFQAGNYSRFKKLVWEHSVVTSIVSRYLCEKLDKLDLQEEAFIAGLLHDIGKVVLNILDRKKFIEAINISSQNNTPLADSEMQVFGFNHLQIGEQAVAQWNLPAIYNSIMSTHKDVEKFDGADSSDENISLHYIVSYANYIAKKCGYGIQSDDDEKDGIILEGHLKISQEERVQIIEEYPPKIEVDEHYKFFMMSI